MVTVRPTLPQDEHIGQVFVAHGLTQYSRYQRFQTGLRELPASAARYLTDIDYQKHFALVAEIFADRDHLQVAEARFVRDAQVPGHAEFALAVADAWQGLGLGSRMLDTLMAAAAAHGITQLYGDVLRDNRAMLGLASGSGFTVRAHPQDSRLLRVLRRAEAPAEVKPGRPARAVSVAAGR
ncbi:MAG: GNAT family N-acetyltransferase [Burkholderiaceae bacterium]